MRYILTNERYAGDELFQKTYRSDSIPFTRYPNDGAKTQFYAENTHPAIIPPHIFDRVQQHIQKKQKAYREKEEYPFTRKLVCSECGSVLYRRVTARGIRWICSRHLYHPNQCKQKGIAETFVQDKFCLLLHKLSQNREAILIQQCAREKYRVCTANGWETQSLAKHLAGQQPGETLDTALFEKIVKSVQISGGQISLQLVNGVILT